MSRFEGERGRERLKEVLQGQPLLCCHHDAVEHIAASAKLREVEPGEILIRQDAPDNSLYFVLSGAFRVFVNGRPIAERGTGQHLGEMAIVDPASRRTSTVIATSKSLVAEVSEEVIRELADRNPRIWQAMARELARRLDERKKFHATPNAKPILFIGSTKEQLPLAEAIRRAIPNAIASVTLWSEGVFGASHFTIDDLEAQLKVSDCALLLATGDDQVISRGKQYDVPRDNIVFELGLFMGALSRNRTFLLVPRGKDVKIPTDLLGITTLRFDPDETDADKAAQPTAAEILELLKKLSPK